MDNKTMESYLDSIAEQVVDEEKIVTYKSLSRSLGVHVNTAKQLLHRYLTNEKSKNSYPISATYLIAGKVIDGSFNVVIVNESDLKLTHSKFIEVTSEHVYSVQKGEKVEDVKALSAVDKELPNEKSSSLVIKYSKGLLKSKEDVKKKSESYEQNNKKIIKQVLAPENHGIRHEKQPSMSEKRESSLINDFTSRGSKKATPKVKIERDNSGKPAKKPSGKITTMFAKAGQKSALKIVKPDRSSSSDEGKDVEVVNEKEGEEVALKTEGGLLRKVGETKKKKNGNKRKRIQFLSDSEESSSESEEQTAKVQIEEPPHPPMNFEEDEVKDTTRNKRKKRKVIDKTVMNEDGYLETKKEIVFETDSEEEVSGLPAEQKKQKVDSAIDKNKRTQSTAKKQSSLLTFFKKN